MFAAWMNSVAKETRERSGRYWHVIRLAPKLSDIELESPSQATTVAQKYGLVRDDETVALTLRVQCLAHNSIVLELRRDEMFPLVALDLLNMLEDRFTGLTGEVLAERPRDGGGAPPLACNVWLENQMSLLQNPEQYHHLYSSWLSQYAKLRGYEPVDPRRSFRAAAQSCLRRIRQKNSGLNR